MSRFDGSEAYVVARDLIRVFCGRQPLQLNGACGGILYRREAYDSTRSTDAECGHRCICDGGI